MHEQLAGYIAGPVNAEDLAVAPGGEWVLTSGMTGPTAPLGRLYAVRVQDGACSEMFPYGATGRLDAERFTAQGDLNPFKFRPHGIDVTLRPDGRTELYVVNHGGSESVEVFEVDLDGSRPALRWLGGVELPGSAVGNDVAAVDDGFVLSTTGDPDGVSEVSVEQAMEGADTGGVLEWCGGRAGRVDDRLRATRVDPRRGVPPARPRIEARVLEGGGGDGSHVLLAGLAPEWHGYLPSPFGDGYEESTSYGRDAVTAIADVLTH